MRPTHIILHHSLTTDGETLSWPGIRTYHTSYKIEGTIVTPEAAKELTAQGVPIQRPWRDIGYHYGIEQFKADHEIMVGRMQDESGAHCPGMRMNHRSLGICLVGNFDKAPPADAQWTLAVRFVRSLMAVFDIAVKNVCGHREIHPDRTCPGRLFDMDVFRRELKGEQNADF